MNVTAIKNEIDAISYFSAFGSCKGSGVFEKELSPLHAACPVLVAEIKYENGVATVKEHLSIMGALKHKQVATFTCGSDLVEKLESMFA